MKVVVRSMFALTVIFFAAVATINAQNDRTKAEVYAGYSYLSTDTGFNDIDPILDSRFGSHGFEASATGNVHRYVGIKGDFSYHSKSEGFVDGTDNLNIRLRTSQFLGGVQFKDNSVDGSRWRPFAHAMAGVAHQSITATGVIAPDTINESASTNNFAMVFGGGLDVRASKHVTIRLIQADYNPIVYRDQNIGGLTLAGRTQSNFRLGAGIVFN